MFVYIGCGKCGKKMTEKLALFVFHFPVRFMHIFIHWKNDAEGYINKKLECIVGLLFHIRWKTFRLKKKDFFGCRKRSVKPDENGGNKVGKNFVKRHFSVYVFPKGFHRVFDLFFHRFFTVAPTFRKSLRGGRLFLCSTQKILRTI